MSIEKHGNLQRRLAETAARVLVDRCDELTALDQAIGDGDHGINMKRGADAVLAQCDEIASMEMPQALTAIGRTLVMKVGGASGPLYGTLLMTLGRTLPAEAGIEDLVRAFDAALDALRKLGRSDVGQKTMLDVLVPVRNELAEGGTCVFERVRRRAADAAAATIPMKAIKGRASFLGDRSIGHMDPGARSSSLIVDAICNVMEE